MDKFELYAVHASATVHDVARRRRWLHKSNVDRRSKVEAALEYKIAQGPEYVILAIDEEAMAQLPESESIAHRLLNFREDRQPEGGGTATPVAAARVDGEND